MPKLVHVDPNARQPTGRSAWRRRSALPAGQLTLLALAACLAACTRNLRLTSPDTDPGARYVCPGEGACREDDTDVPSDEAVSGTTYVTLPRQCGGRIHQIWIADAGSSTPRVGVTCAPREDPIETMGEPAASQD